MDDLWVLIANPVAGRGRGRKMAERAALALQRAGRPVELHYTCEKGHGTALARQAVAEGAGRLIVCGGDGTVRETLPALAGSRTALGLLPFGTANDLARCLGVPRNLAPAVRVLLQGQVHSMDLGRMGDQLFATVAAFGFDAEISHSMSSGQAPFSGTVGYLWQTLRHLPRFRPPRVCLQGEFGLIEQEVLLVATANTRRYGGGLCIAPQADPRDGYFDLCIVDPVPFHTVLPMLPRLFWGGHVGHPAVRLERTAWLRLETEEPCLLHADGEYLGQTPAALEISPAALRVVLPRPARALA